MLAVGLAGPPPPGWEEVCEDDLGRHLSDQSDARPIDVLVLGPKAGHPVNLVQQLYRGHPEVPVVVIDGAVADRAVADRAVADRAVTDRAVTDRAVTDRAVTDRDDGNGDRGPHRRDGVMRALRRAPEVPLDIEVLVEPAAPDLEAAVRQAAGRARVARRHRELMALLNEKMAAASAEQRRATTAVPGGLGPLLANVGLAAVVTDTAGRLITWNDPAATVLGIDAAAEGRRLAELFADPGPPAAALAQASSGRQGAITLEVRAEGRAGEVRPGGEGAAGEGAAGEGAAGEGGMALELSAAPTSLEDGSAAILVLLLDVSARRDAERARAELAARLASSLRSQAFLLKASDVLAQVDGYSETLDRLADIAVPSLADFCVIYVLDETGRPKRDAARHAEGSCRAILEEIGWRYPAELASRHPAMEAIRSGKSLLSEEADDDLLRAIAHDEHHLELLRQLCVTSCMVVPLKVGEDVLGSVTLVAAGSARHFGADDLALAESLAGRVAGVVAKERRYDQEHQLAEVLQRGMLTALPDVPPVQLAARYVPARRDREVGGDWYDAFVLPDGSTVPGPEGSSSQGRRTVLIVGDVIGHDLGAATKMGELRNVLRTLAFDRREPPSQVLARLDAVNEGLRITELVTVLYGILDLEPSAGAGGPGAGAGGAGAGAGGAGAGDRYRFCWANAGHPPPVLVNADGEAVFLDDNLGTAVGLPGRAERRDAVVFPPPGSTLLLYTDGLVERRGDQLETGMPELLEQASHIATWPLEDACDHLVSSARTASEDDIAILAVRFPDGPGRS
ncbi:MAG: PP2C family protein-serine/threonine phosphatase [Acidimicrobiales bacterium]